MSHSYRGRFAPTPSGPLHLGSLQTALASYLAARQQGGRWLLRLDDLDAARCSRRAAETILRQLEAHGLQWDEEIYWQSDQAERYRAALEQLSAAGGLYRCDCKRARLAAYSRPGPYGRIYDGHCRDHPVAEDAPASLRLQVPSRRLGWDDAGYGRLEADLRTEIGDFVARRRDGVPGYQLACAVDEIAMAITEVVRGADLIGSTFCQQLLLCALQQAPPRYRHLPLRRDAAGRKLSKQNHAAPLSSEDAASNLRGCLEALGQSPPEPAACSSAQDVLAWALAHWDSARIPQARVASSDVEVD